MRLKSEIWVQAFLRSQEIAGHFGAVLRVGAAEAGAVCVVINHLDGTLTLLGPAPGAAYDTEGNRRFVRETAAPVDWPVVRDKLDRKAGFDPDIWVVEIEDRQGLAGLQPEQD